MELVHINFNDKLKCSDSDRINTRTALNLEYNIKNMDSNQNLSYFGGVTSVEEDSAEKQRNDSGINEENTSFNQVQMLIDENASLHMELAKVTEMNKKWHEYNKERQKYVASLLKKIENLESQVYSLQTESEKISSTHSDNGFMDKKTVPREQFVILQSSHQNAVKYNCSLEKRLAETVKTLEKTEQKLDELKSEYKDHIRLSGMQVKSHIDDWKTERSERNKASDMCKRLFHELNSLKKTPQENRWSGSDISLAAISTSDLPRSSSPINRLQCEQNTIGETCSDTFAVPQQTEDFECPNCYIKFNVSEFDRLLEHSTYCQNRRMTS